MFLVTVAGTRTLGKLGLVTVPVCFMLMVTLVIRRSVTRHVSCVTCRVSRDTCVMCPMLPRVTCASLTDPAIPSCLAPGAAGGVLALLAPDWSRLSSPGR